MRDPQLRSERPCSQHQVSARRRASLRYLKSPPAVPSPLVSSIYLWHRQQQCRSGLRYLILKGNCFELSAIHSSNNCGWKNPSTDTSETSPILASACRSEFYHQEPGAALAWQNTYGESAEGCLPAETTASAHQETADGSACPWSGLPPAALPSSPSLLPQLQYATRARGSLESLLDAHSVAAGWLHV